VDNRASRVDESKGWTGEQSNRSTVDRVGMMLFISHPSTPDPSNDITHTQPTRRTAYIVLHLHCVVLTLPVFILAAHTHPGLINASERLLANANIEEKGFCCHHPN
jgi:hypothetical protein